jgi:hypothetical protein
LSDPQIERLIALTTELEHQVPALAGAFPELQALRDAVPQGGAGGAPRCAVYVLGTIKSGKSTLINALLGRDVMPRGAGVKTFNLVHVVHGPEATARVRFRSPGELAALLAFDFRMLGFAVELPPDPYAPEAIDALERTREAFEVVCRNDERLQGVEAEGASLGLLALSLARMRHTIAGLRELARDFSEADRAQLRTRACLDYGGDRFPEHLRWTDSADLAALIHDIELVLPFPDTTPRSFEFVDCQGSDSLNPLDFADVQSIVQRADVILYVVQSRLGLRQADHALLRHLARVRAADRLVGVVNVEAFEPLGEEEFDRLLGRIEGDLARSAGRAVPCLPVNALLALDRAGEGADAEMMATLWRRRGAEARFERLRHGHTALLERLRGAAPIPEEASGFAGHRVLEGFVRQAEDAARALLDRDLQVLGVQSSSMSREEARLAVQRILEGERKKLRADAAKATDAAFDALGPIQREIDAFLDTGAERWVEERPLPVVLEDSGRPGTIVDVALETFNADWLRGRARTREATLETLQGEFATRLGDGVVRVLRMLPQVLPAALLERSRLGGEAPEKDSARLAERRARVGEAMGRRDAPHLLDPVVLPGTFRRAMVAEYHSRRLLGAFGRRDDQGDASTAQRNGVLWKRCVQGAMRQARDDRSHALLNVRENYKYQYFYRLVDDVLDGLGGEIMAEIDAHYAGLERLEAARRLLLDTEQRARVEAYLEAIEALVEPAADRVPV